MPGGRLSHEPGTARAELLKHTAHRCLGLKQDRAIVAVDGVDGSGKTVFADELAVAILTLGRSVVRASVDGFHYPREHRYRRGRNSPEGFFLDSYDYDALMRYLLLPFRCGAGTIRTACFDHRTNQEVTSSLARADAQSILLIDGIFLHRDELADNWDLSVFLDVPFAVSYTRMADRDGSNPDPETPENRRYLEGQRLYLGLCGPRERATLVVDNADLEAPRILAEKPRPPDH